MGFVEDTVEDVIGWVDDAADWMVDTTLDIGKEIGQYVPGVSTALAGRETKKLYEQNAAANKKTSERQAAVMLKELEKKNALARAAGAASGVVGVSRQVYYDALDQAGREEIAWAQAVGMQEYQLALAEGDLAFDKAMASFWGDVFSMATLGSSF